MSQDTCIIDIKQASEFDFNELDIPGDKSISHRLAIIGAMANNRTRITGYLKSQDCLNTLEALKKLSIPIDQQTNTIHISGQNKTWKPLEQILDIGNSGTAIRLLTGALASQDFEITLTGDASIQKRPMGRVLDPLALMGLNVQEKASSKQPPITFKGSQSLNGIHYSLPVASAQVKSAIMLAAIRAKSPSVIHEPIKTRDHTERLLTYFGAQIKKQQHSWHISGQQELCNPYPNEAIHVPSDLSSASFFIVLILLLSKQPVCIKDIGLNPSRTGLLHVIKAMGIRYSTDLVSHPFEAMGNLTIHPSPIKNISVPDALIPNIIDEIPILSVLASKGAGTFKVSHAEELRVKESDRLAAIERLYKAAKLHIDTTQDGFSIKGPQQAQEFVFDAQHDHRLAMSAIVLAISHKVPAHISGCASIPTSFPNFFECLEKSGIKVSLS